MRIKGRIFGGFVIKFEKDEELMLHAYIKALKTPGVHCIAHLLGHFFDKQIEVVLDALSELGILKKDDS